MAKRSTRKLPPGFLERVKRSRATILRQEMPELVAKGREIGERRERLREAIQALKAEREAQGVSLAEMQSRTGISRASLSRLENDLHANPTVSTLDRIARALGKQVLIQLTDRKPAA